MASIDWNKKRKLLRPIVILLWILGIIGFAAAAFALWSANESDLPSFEDLENPKYDLASLIYDHNGEVFGKYYIENREQVDFKDLSPVVLNALMSTEDTRFYSHAGVDLQALFRVAFKTVLLQQESSGGGSTISQQLAKLLYKRPSLKNTSKFARMMDLVSIKMKEWITAVKLETSYTKEEIISMYLNKFEFINGAHGIQSAAEVYFGKNQEELNVSEAATLVGMLQNPARFNPVRFEERTRDRRNVVLELLKKNDHIDKDAFDSLSVKPIDLSNFKRENHSDGPAPYFRIELTKWLKDLFDQDRYEKPEGGKYNIYTDGLKIYTTIDLGYQKHAESSVRDHMEWLQNRYWDRWKYKDPMTFEADSLQLVQRHESVMRRVHYSERYQGLFDKHFAEINKKVADQYEGFALTEPALRIIFDATNYQKGIQKLKEGKLQTNFNKITKESIWSEIKDVWKTFRSAYEKEFNTKMNLTVFDYKEGEVDKEMTPLDSIRYHLRHLQNGMMAADPKTGHIKAWVGGINHKYFKFDHVNSRRQVGSTIKPFVYATAIALSGISPCQEYDDIQYTVAPGDVGLFVDEEWSPSNANGEFTGNKYNLYQGLLYSKNSISVKLVKEMGSVEVIRDLLNNVGIDKKETHSTGRLLVPAIPSLVLGSVDLSVMEMTGAYTAFANNGVYTEPVFIDYIEDKNGKVIYRSTPNQKRALNPVYNAVMVDMLKNNTGGRFGLGVKTENGGKTGTTNEYADAWFMGITPNLVVGTWVGGDEKWVRFYTLDDGQGFVMARPIFKEFLKRIEADEELNYNPDMNFVTPPSEYYDIIDCDRYKQKDVEAEAQERILTTQVDDEFEEEEFGFGDDFEEELEELPFEEEGEMEELPLEEEEIPDTIRINRHRR